MGELVTRPVGGVSFFAGVVSWELSDSRPRVAGVVGVVEAALPLLWTTYNRVLKQVGLVTAQKHELHPTGQRLQLPGRV
jgi:hypothetical protein